MDDDNRCPSFVAKSARRHPHIGVAAAYHILGNHRHNRHYYDGGVVFVDNLYKSSVLVHEVVIDYDDVDGALGRLLPEILDEGHVHYVVVHAPDSVNVVVALPVAVIL